MTRARRRFWMVILYAATALPVLAYGAVRAMDSNANSPLDWVPATFPPRQVYDQFQGVFGSGDVVVMSWPGCSIHEPRLDELVVVLQNHPAFKDEQGRNYFERVVTGRQLFQSLLSPPISLSESGAVQRLRGTLVGPDGTTTCVIVAFSREALAKRQDIVPLMKRAVEVYCGVPPLDLHAVGPVIDGLSVDVASKDSLHQFAVPSALVVLLFCWYCLRSLRASLMVFGISILAQATTLAFVYYAGASMSALLIVMPPLVQVLAVAGGIHLVNYYFDATASGEPHPAQRAFQLGWLPCVLSSGTTAVGMASLMVSQLQPIREFGAFASVGVLVATALTLFIIPGTFSVWPLDLARRKSESETGSVGEMRWRRWVKWLAPRHFLVTGAAILAMMAMGCGLTRMTTSVRIETLFTAESQILADYRWLERNVAPLVPIEIVLSCDETCHLSFRQRLELLKSIDAKLRTRDEVRGTLSALSLLPSIPDVTSVEPADYHQSCDEVCAVAYGQLCKANFVAQSEQNQLLRLTAYVSTLGGMDYGELLGDLRADVEPLLCEDGRRLQGISVRLTGIMPLVHEIQRQLFTVLFASFLSAFVVIAIVMTLAQGGIMAGTIAMIPNLFPIVILFGLLGWLGMPMDIGTVMTASVAIGIAVDDTLHFLTFFQRALDQGQSQADAVTFAYRHCAVAMLQSSLICGLGMVVFAFSDFVPTSRFAWMMTMLLAMALVGDLLLLPALLLGPCGRLFNSQVTEEEPLPSSGPDQRPTEHTGAMLHAA